MSGRPGGPSSAHFTLVTGGTRSGKSRFAVELAKTFGRRIVYIATCHPADAQMRQRVDRHRRERPAHWVTVEQPANLSSQLARLTAGCDGALFDCLTMYVSDLVLKKRSDAAIQRDVRRLCEAIRHGSVPVAMVTNEVGSGVVPDHPLGRRFRDVAGMANQLAARVADRVVLMVSGLPLVIKDHNTRGTRLAAYEPSSGPHWMPYDAARGGCDDVHLFA